jgi:hypothetical protein
VAKALLGHVGIGADAMLAAEVRRLRARVRELEEELERMRALGTDISVPDEELIALQSVEPALT